MVRKQLAELLVEVEAIRRHGQEAKAYLETSHTWQPPEDGSKRGGFGSGDQAGGEGLGRGWGAGGGEFFFTGFSASLRTRTLVRWKWPIW